MRGDINAVDHRFRARFVRVVLIWRDSWIVDGTLSSPPAAKNRLLCGWNILVPSSYFLYQNEGPNGKPLKGSVQLSDSVTLRTLATVQDLAPLRVVSVVLQIRTQPPAVLVGACLSALKSGEFLRSMWETARACCSHTSSFDHLQDGSILGGCGRGSDNLPELAMARVGTGGGSCAPLLGLYLVEM